MPILQRDDAEIYFEEYGSGYPVLLFAPGGLRSRLEMWHNPDTGPARVWNDWTAALAGQFRVIAMDQRNAGLESRLEVNIFDFDADLYDTEITVSLHSYIREERKFAGLDALKAQIAADAAEARRLL